MNDTIRSLFERKSVRVFDGSAITAEEKELILLSAVQAPTAGNQQMYSILDITSQELKDRLAVTCDNQPFIATAPLVLIFCADMQKWYDAFTAAGCAPREPGAGDLLLAEADAFIAAQNAVVAAQSMGIGSCYIGDILERCEEHRELLSLPDHVVPVCMLVFGRPTKAQLERIKPLRHKLGDIVMENGYKRKDEAALREMFREKSADKGFDAWMQAFCARKYNSDFSREMSRSAEKYLEKFRA